MIKLKILAWILDKIGFTSQLDSMAWEIKCNKEYIDHLENTLIPALQEKIKKLKEENKSFIEKRSGIMTISSNERLLAMENGNLRKEIFDLKNHNEYIVQTLKKLNQARGEFCSDKWISCNSMLPNVSINELLVTDGDISSVASFDINTKQFLRVYGSQTMRIPSPIAWQFIPDPPQNNGDVYHPPKVNKRKGLELTYIRD